MLNFKNFSCLSLCVSIVQNLQSYAFSSLYGQLYLQESARLNFTHTQREIASSLSIFCTRFKNLGTPFLQLLFWHTKHWKTVEGLIEPVMHNCIPVQRKLEKTSQSVNNNPTYACSCWNNSGTTIDLEKRLVQSLDKVLKITFQHKAALGL